MTAIKNDDKCVLINFDAAFNSLRPLDMFYFWLLNHSYGSQNPPFIDFFTLNVQKCCVKNEWKNYAKAFSLFWFIFLAACRF